MKKLLAAPSAAVISAGALVSCGSSGSSSSKDAQPAAVETTAPDYSSGDASLIVGKWYMSPETAEQLKTESDLDVLTTSYIEFFADGSVNVFEEANMSSNLFLTDDIISLNGDETEYTFDGKDITVPTGESTVLFKRADSYTSSELYGTYTCEVTMAPEFGNAASAGSLVKVSTSPRALPSMELPLAVGLVSSR